MNLLKKLKKASWWAMRPLRLQRIIPTTILKGACYIINVSLKIPSRDNREYHNHGKTTSKVTQKLLCSHTVIFNGVYVQTAPKISPVLLLGQDFFN